MVLLGLVHPTLMEITTTIGKHKMMFFLKMKGEKVWNLVEYGWGPLLILDAQGRSTGELKSKNECDKINNEGSKANVRLLFSIFNGVCPNKLCMIANCKCAKEA